jgi:two-component system response regulator
VTPDGPPAHGPALPDELDLLLVEEDPLEVELLLRPLAELLPLARVGIARAGEEALDYLLARGPYRHRLGSAPPRLILLALRLPPLDGVDVLRALRASPRTATVPAVILTSSDETREVAQCYQAGANSCIRKPVGFRELEETIGTLGRYWLRLNSAPPGRAGVG